MVDSVCADNTPIVTSVTVTYNSRSTIGPLLDAAYQSHQLGLLEVVVVDNASSDGTLAFVREEYPWVTAVDAGGNLGFARGCNKGSEYLRGDFILLLNPDAILSLEALQGLIDFFDRNTAAAIAAPAIREADGMLQHAGGLPTPSTIIRSASGVSESEGVSQTIEPGGEPFRTNWLCGAILMIRREAFVQLDGFDPRYFLYFDETDLCRRAIDADMEIWAVGKAIAYHEGGGSAKHETDQLVSSCIPEHFYQSRFYYLCKFFGLPVAVLTEFAEIVLLTLRALLRMVLLRPSDGVLRARLAGPIAQTPPKVEPEPRTLNKETGR